MRAREWEWTAWESREEGVDRDVGSEGEEEEEEGTGREIVVEYKRERWAMG